MKKKFDCVELQRELRRDLADRYPKAKNRELLDRLRKEFGNRIKHPARG